MSESSSSECVDDQRQLISGFENFGLYSENDAGWTAPITSSDKNKTPRNEKKEKRHAFIHEKMRKKRHEKRERKKLTPFEERKARPRVRNEPIDIDALPIYVDCSFESHMTEKVSLLIYRLHLVTAIDA